MSDEVELRAHDYRRQCRWCGKTLHCLSRQRVTCSERCRVRLAYHQRNAGAKRYAPHHRYEDAAPSSAQAREPLASELSRESARRIEATIAKWEAYHRARRTYRLSTGWDGYQVRYER
jgi:predicted nucleic acid-binding Zn ribbon protein